MWCFKDGGQVHKEWDGRTPALILQHGEVPIPTICIADDPTLYFWLLQKRLASPLERMNSH
jgi:hypothetical protein